MPLPGFPCDEVEDLDASSDTLDLCPLCPSCDKGVEGFDEGTEGLRGRGFDGARKPSYSKKSSWAPI